MKLINLQVRLVDYGPTAGQYTGRVEFTDAAANVELRLTPEMCERIFLVCADSLLVVAKEAAANLTCNVIEHRKQLEEQK